MNKLANKYIISEFKRHTFRFLKEFILLIPVICIISMFATMVNVIDVNNKQFLKSSSYESVGLSEKSLGYKNEFKTFNCALSTSKDVSSNAYVFKYNDNVTLFSANNRNYSIENTIFNNKNIYKSSINPIFQSSNSIPAIAITYDTAKKLKVHIGGSVYIVLNINKEPGIIEQECKVVSILKPMYYDKSSKIALVQNNVNFSKKIDGNVDFTYITYSDKLLDNKSFTKVLTRSQQINSVSASIKDNSVPNLIFPWFGAILIFLLTYREFQFNIRNNLKNIAILSSLGTNKKIINSIFATRFISIYLLSSIAAAFIYKYLLVQQLIGRYMPLGIFFMVFIISMMIGLLSVYINIKLLNKKLEKYPVNEVLGSRLKEVQ